VVSGYQLMADTVPSRVTGSSSYPDLSLWHMFAEILFEY